MLSFLFIVTCLSFIWANYYSIRSGTEGWRMWVDDNNTRRSFYIKDALIAANKRCHSTRSLSTSWAAITEVPLEAICEAASWMVPNTFARFYRVNMATPHPLQGALEQPPSASR
ncbi:hypothetical protein CHARACLAT_017183 [Characodon lateralis]|uniref:Uncharacterized protein n=1 Tax=Characodon lateralis TaxID=208331 RepID=A0ABU7EUL8_9TELE|nr:hypothetical protein [Characodon lateralis]